MAKVTRTHGLQVSRRRLLQTASFAGASLAFGRAIRPARATPLAVEKEDLKLGFIKLTDMAPLAIAKEKGFFEEEGLNVTLEAQANWKVLLDRVIDGQLDGAHMLAGQPLGATIGIGTKAPVVTAFSMDLNGNGITVSNEVWEMMKPHIPVDASGKPVSGDLTGLVRLYDAGTEKDELPGAGSNQAPRQKAMNQGPSEGGNVRMSDDGFAYPAVESVIKVTVTPAS